MKEAFSANGLLEYLIQVALVWGFVLLSHTLVTSLWKNILKVHHDPFSLACTVKKHGTHLNSADSWSPDSPSPAQVSWTALNLETLEHESKCLFCLILRFFLVIVMRDTVATADWWKTPVINYCDIDWCVKVSL